MASLSASHLLLAVSPMERGRDSHFGHSIFIDRFKAGVPSARVLLSAVKLELVKKVFYGWLWISSGSTTLTFRFTSADLMSEQPQVISASLLQYSRVILLYVSCV